MSTPREWLIQWHRGLALADRLGGWRLLADARPGSRERLQPGDLRDYSPGDDLSLVNWWVAARRDELLTRRGGRSLPLPVYLLVDRSASMGLGTPCKWDLARRIAGQLACAVTHQRRPLGIAMFDRGSLNELPQIRAGIPQLPPSPASGRGPGGEGLPQQKSAVIAEADGPAPPSAIHAIEAFARRNQPRGVTVVISDFFDPEVRAGLESLRRRGYQPRAVQVYAAEEADPAWLGAVELLDVEQGHRCPAMLTNDVLRRYRDAFQAFLQTWRRSCLRRTIACLQFSTTASHQDLLHGLLAG